MIFFIQFFSENNIVYSGQFSINCFETMLFLACGMNVNRNGNGDH